MIFLPLPLGEGRGEGSQKIDAQSSIESLIRPSATFSRREKGSIEAVMVICPLSAFPNRCSTENGRRSRIRDRRKR